MDKSVGSYLLALELGAPQGFENMAVYPLLASLDGGPEYIPLKTALERGVFAVTEVSAGGSVPDLLVTNKADVAVLLLDGEELAGAKQNRVLNTTILVAPRASVKVPVSCTEQGRWHYVSKEFQDSGNVLAAAMRGAHHREVNLSLASSRQYQADQSRVWGRVASMARVMDVASATGAMRDVFEARSADLDGYLKSFSLVDHQKGFLVLLDGRPAGFDFI